MATELLFVPCGWLEEFEPSDMLRPKKNNKKIQVMSYTCLLSAAHITP